MSAHRDCMPPPADEAQAYPTDWSLPKPESSKTWEQVVQTSIETVRPAKAVHYDAYSTSESQGMWKDVARAVLGVR